jgi:YD repeat-containing protein
MRTLGRLILAGAAWLVAACPASSRPTGAIMNDRTTVTTVLGTTRTYGPDGQELATVASPRVTLDASGDVLAEERLAADGTVLQRRRFAGGGRLEEEERFAGGALDLRIVYHHDDAGRVTEEVQSFGDGSPQGRWVNHRDDAGRLLRREFVGRGDAVEAVETYAFSADGLTATVERARVGVWTYGYDPEGRVVSKRGGPISGDEMDQVALEYAYDGRGRLVRETERNASGGLVRELRIEYPAAAAP